MNGRSLTGLWVSTVERQAPPAFTPSSLDGEIVYVGVTQNGLQTRMDQYRRGHTGQKTSSRVNGLIRQGLAEGRRVQAMFVLPAASEWNGLPVDGAAGLEAALIRLIQPRWNKRGLS